MFYYSIILIFYLYSALEHVIHENSTLISSIIIIMMIEGFDQFIFRSDGY